MCILAFLSQKTGRWPFIFIHNRDEYVSRATAALQVDPAGILWARDELAANGGSWLGFNTRTGSFAALTNCRRAPTTVLGMPFEEIAKRCHMDDNGFVMFQADASRGTLIRDFLTHEALPPSSAWTTPMMDGYNLLTTNMFLPFVARKGDEDQTLDAKRQRTFDHIHVTFSTNRYSEAHDAGLDPDVVYALSNSTINNQKEPKTMFLRERVEAVAKECNEMTLDEVVAALSSALCAQNGFEVDDTELSKSLPFSGITEQQKEQLLGRPLDASRDAKAFIGGWNVEKEALLQRDVFVSSCGPTYRTRTQTVVLVERRDNEHVVHFWMRQCDGPTSHGEWSKFQFPCRSN